MESNRRIKEGNQMIKLVTGLIIGVYIGIGIMCLFQINRGEEDE